MVVAASFSITPAAPARASEITVTTPTEIAAAFGTDGSTVTLGGPISVSRDDTRLVVPANGHITLDLAGHRLETRGGNYDAGIEVELGSHLTIQDSGSGGVLQVEGGTYGAGIGARYSGDGGTVTINGGTVIAQGGENGAGIGGGTGTGDTGIGGTTIINGGTVTATGGNSAAGIGGGSNGLGGTTTISGGTVTARGGAYGSGIGGGAHRAGGNTTISGGTVTATAGRDSSGIGGGLGKAGGSTTISGGEVLATGSGTGAAIGGSDRGAGGDLTIGPDALVTVASGEPRFASPTIGGGLSSTAFGTLDNQGTLTVASGSMLAIPADAWPVNSGRLINNGTLSNSGTFGNSGVIANAGQLNNAGALENTGSIVNSGTATVNDPQLGITRNNFRLEFDTRNGSPAGTIAPLRAYATSLASAEIALPLGPTAVPTGHSFGGWVAGDPAVAFTRTSTISADTTVSALWIPNSHAVTFDARGGSPVTGIAADFGSRITAPVAPERAGYAFAGWFTDAGATLPWDFDTARIAGDLTLHAGWDANSHTVTFDARGGVPVASVTADFDSTITAPDEPTRAGHGFTGWFTNPEATVPWDFDTALIAGDLTLYAGWSVNSYAVTFDARGGSPVAGITADFGTRIAEPSAPERLGYTFAGWFTNDTATSAWDFHTARIRGRADPLCGVEGRKAHGRL
ncbi:hypothetical protein GY24_14550 [Microterricola pindariensis]|uniref:Bacterial repeat domain-containing protein n=1 Tax=Microterricola pindariensis TaxID=478010 RepID=A0ABX5ASD8_9MICO|nr:hypothetical protein GY24_14550 [Microterricola pindariensis]